MVYSKGCHTVFCHRHHVVWATKCRFDVLRGELRLRVREIIRQTCQELGIGIIEGVLSRDHVHMFLAIPPRHSVSDVMRRIKGKRPVIHAAFSVDACVWAVEGHRHGRSSSIRLMG